MQGHRGSGTWNFGGERLFRIGTEQTVAREIDIYQVIDVEFDFHFFNHRLCKIISDVKKKFTFYIMEGTLHDITVNSLIMVKLNSHWIMAKWVECSPIVREAGVQSPVKSYQKTQKMVLDAALLSTIRWGLRVKWSKPGKGVASSLHLGVVAIEKGAFGSPSTKVANFTFTHS